MKGDEVRLKIIKDTVVSSMMPEIREDLKSRVADEKKRKEMIRLTQSKLDIILKTMGEKELLPVKDFSSQREFEEHILKIVKRVRQRLLTEVEKEN